MCCILLKLCDVSWSVGPITSACIRLVSAAADGLISPLMLCINYICPLEATFMQLMTAINGLHAEVTRWGGIYVTCVQSYKLCHSHADVSQSIKHRTLPGKNAYNSDHKKAPY